jgi:hypothetical protein
LENGRIHGVSATGIDPADVAAQLPMSLSELAPLIKFTMGGRRGSEVDGLVELLNNKVIDPRLLKKLLRLQASILLRSCFAQKLISFRFEHAKTPPTLVRKLPLDISLLALLVEGEMECRDNRLAIVDPSTGFARRAIRGQNLDRAGLSSRHMQLMSVLAQPMTVQKLSEQLGWPVDEVARVIHGFELAELVERQQVRDLTHVFAVATQPNVQQRIASFFKSSEQTISGKLLRDWLALGLLLRRQRPHALVVEISDEASLSQLHKLQNDPAGYLTGVQVVCICTDNAHRDKASVYLSHTILGPDFDQQQLRNAIEVNGVRRDPQPTSTSVPPSPFHQDSTPLPSALARLTN